MEEDKHKSREWSIDIDHEKDMEEVLEPAKNCCIYRVPQRLRKIKEEAYTPSLISIGPLHYGKKELMGMENHKKRYWLKFRERVGAQKFDAQKLKEFKTYIETQEKNIRDCYSVTSTLSSSKYVKIILRDAVFIIELFLLKFLKSDDFLLKKPLEISITADLLLLENQLPYFIFNDLYAIAFPTSKGHPSIFFDISVNFFKGASMFNPSLKISAVQPHEQLQEKHFTDILRRSLLMTQISAEQPQEEHVTDVTDDSRCSLLTTEQPIVLQSNGVGDDQMIYDLPCATKLNKSGLKFEGNEDKCLLKISWGERKYAKWLSWFEVNKVKIPRIEIFDETECLLRNLMALEMFLYPTETHISNYALLMDYLVDTEEDVDLLAEKNIIFNGLGDNKAICKMFNGLSSLVTFSGSIYYEDAEKMKSHYNSKWNHAKAALKRVYFNNIWTGTATIAATFLLILTLIQTVCSIVQLL